MLALTASIGRDWDHGWLRPPYWGIPSKGSIDWLGPPDWNHGAAVLMAQASCKQAGDTSWRKIGAVFQKFEITGSSNLTSKTPKPSWRLPPLNLTPLFRRSDFYNVFHNNRKTFGKRKSAKNNNIHNGHVTFALEVPFWTPCKILKTQRQKVQPPKLSETTIFIMRIWGGHPINSQVAILLTPKMGKDGHPINSQACIYICIYI